MPEHEQRRKHDLAHVPVQKYLEAHTKPNGGGWRGFVHSNLFTGLILFSLTQAALVGASFVGNIWRTTIVAKDQAKLEVRVDTNEKAIGELKATAQEHGSKLKVDEDNIREMKEDTKHFDVMEREHARLTTENDKLRIDVDKLKEKK